MIDLTFFKNTYININMLKRTIFNKLFQHLKRIDSTLFFFNLSSCPAAAHGVVEGVRPKAPAAAAQEPKRAGGGGTGGGRPPCSGGGKLGLRQGHGGVIGG